MNKNKKKVLSWFIGLPIVMLSISHQAQASFWEYKKSKTSSFVHAQVNVKKSMVNLNTATLKQLVTLKGIGPKKAQTIIHYRNTKGKFHVIKDLMHVKGIHAKFLQKLLHNNPKRIIVK